MGSSPLCWWIAQLWPGSRKFCSASGVAACRKKTGYGRQFTSINSRRNVEEDVGRLSPDPQRAASAPLPDRVLLAVHVEEGAIHVHPQFMLVNCLPYPVFFRQAATPEALQNFLLPGHSG